jgi:hypothetical protein
MYKITSYATTLLLLTATLATKKIQAQWDIEESHTTASLRGIHNVGGGVAWASGTNGTVLRTEDGGYLWQTCTIPPGAEKLDFRGIQAFDENTAIVMSSGKGDLSRLYKTTNGCQTWKLLFTNPNPEGFWDAESFRDSKTGFILGDPIKVPNVVPLLFELEETNDGGITWKAIQSKETALYLSADPAGAGAFAASNSSLLTNPGIYFGTGGKGGAFLYSGGLAQIICNCRPPLPPGAHSPPMLALRKDRLPLSYSESAGIFSIGFRNSGSKRSPFPAFVAVGGDYKNPDKRDGTAAFQIPRTEKWDYADTYPGGYRSSVAFDQSTGIWITVGPNGTDISTDDGKNWHPLTPSGYDPPDADKNWNALSLPFVVGPHGRIGRLRTIPKPQK